ncbi:MAG: hypothetical protein J6Y33_02395 [Prevotella sp.]|nr:hypothetical protein [Prevotella sp.]
MSKKSFFVRSFAVALGALLYVSCDKRDNPIGPEPEPEDPMIEEITYEDVTAMVAVDKWGQAGFTGSWAAPEVDTKDGRHSGMAEVYGEGDAVINATGVLLQQTIEGLQPGKYTVDLYANAMYTPDRGFNSDMEDNAEDVAYLFANDKKIFIVAKRAATTTKNPVYSFEAEVGEDGILVLGLGKEKGGTNWHNIQIKELALQVVNTRPMSEAYAELQPEIDALSGKAMPADAKTLLELTLAEPRSQENLEALKLALKAAHEGALIYDEVKVTLDAMKALIDGTNVYTEAALNEYYTKYAEKFEAGTLEEADVNALQNPDKVTGWHDAISCDEFLLSVWDTNPNFQDAPYYINTWSTEGDNDGSNFHVPFFEYWTQDTNSLGERTLTATMTGIAAGNYEVSAWVRVRAKNGYEAPAYGITLQANDGEAVNVAAGTQIGTSQFYLDTFTAKGTVGADGVLKIKFIVAADNNISWLSFKNVKFEKK